MVVRRCRHLLRDEEHALDAMQDVFVLALRKQDTLDDRGLASLLYRMATNVCLNKLRSKRRRPEDPQQELLQKIADSTSEDAANTTRNMLARLFAREQESTAAMAVYHYLDGMSLEEVAARVNMSVSGVRKRLRGLRARLHEFEVSPS